MDAASLRTARELVSLGRAPLDLSDEDATYVFDALLACEATWHRGQALATTVHTCLYMHDRERLEAAPSLVVRAYLEATRSAVATVRHAVQCGDIYEEEDFVISANGFDVGEPASADVGGDDGAARRANDKASSASSASSAATRRPRRGLPRGGDLARRKRRRRRPNGRAPRARALPRRVSVRTRGSSRGVERRRRRSSRAPRPTVARDARGGEAPAKMRARR